MPRRERRAAVWRPRGKMDEVTGPDRRRSPWRCWRSVHPHAFQRAQASSLSSVRPDSTLSPPILSAQPLVSQLRPQRWLCPAVSRRCGGGKITPGPADCCGTPRACFATRVQRGAGGKARPGGGIARPNLVISAVPLGPRLMADGYYVWSARPPVLPNGASLERTGVFPCR